MTAKVISNRGYSNFGGGSQGIGGNQAPDGSIGWVGIVGKVGDVAFLRAVDCTSLDKVQQGYFFQSTGSANIDFTLVNGERAINPDPQVQAIIPWANTLPLTTTAITKSLVAFAAIRITFVTACEVYCVAR
jgi:hypothetical protein